MASQIVFRPAFGQDEPLPYCPDEYQDPGQIFSHPTRPLIMRVLPARRWALQFGSKVATAKGEDGKERYILRGRAEYCGGWQGKPNFSLALSLQFLELAEDVPSGRGFGPIGGQRFDPNAEVTMYFGRPVKARAPGLISPSGSPRPRRLVLSLDGQQIDERQFYGSGECWEGMPRGSGTFVPSMPLLPLLIGSRHEVLELAIEPGDHRGSLDVSALPSAFVEGAEIMTQMKAERRRQFGRCRF